MWRTNTKVRIIVLNTNTPANSDGKRTLTNITLDNGQRFSFKTEEKEKEKEEKEEKEKEKEKE